MLKDERLSRIVQLVNKNKTMRTDDLALEMETSLATIRRDLTELNDAGKVKKIFGGVKSIDPMDFITTEQNMGEKSQIKMKEKIAIAEYAAELIEDFDFVYLDAGTSVEAMLAFIKAKHLTFVTNSLTIAKELSVLNQSVYILPGEIKLSTDSIVGVGASEYLKRFNFTIGFFGANGVHNDVGFTTPDINEAMVKQIALERCKKAYILADRSKFGKVSQITFCRDFSIPIISDCINEEGKLIAEIVELEGN